MNLLVRHHSVYRYAHEVTASQHVLYLRPRTTARQMVIRSRVALSPPPAGRFVFADKFGNTAEEVEIAAPHLVLDVQAESEVRVAPAGATQPRQSVPWEEVRRLAERPGSDLGSEMVPYLFSARYTAPTREIEAYARQSFAARRPVLEAAIEIMARIHGDFRYDPAATDVMTPVSHAFAMRAGVCQDLAHAAIACLRAMGLAARYVSGYLLTDDEAPGAAQASGAGHSHAWFAVFAPPFGWVDLDATNNCPASGGHVTLAWGRDYADVAPVSGTVTGGGAHSVEVAVTVAPV